MTVAILLARVVLAGVFAVAAAGKLMDLAGSREAVAGFGVPRVLARPVGTLLPFAELAASVLLVLTAGARAGAVLAAALLLAFAAGIAVNLARGRAVDCHCFGAIHSAPAGPATLARNVVLAALALLVAVRAAQPSLSGWVADRSQATTVALALGAVCLGLAAFCVALLRQNGRILLRLDLLEEQVRSGAPSPVVGYAPAPGPAVGSVAPAFTLAGLHGETATLASLLAAEVPVVLLFTDPDCAPCRALLPQVGRWQAEHAGELTIALVAGGTAEATRAEAREHGLRNVLLQSAREVRDAYGVTATPTAVLIGRDGRVALPPAGGADAIAELLHAAVPGGHGADVVRVIPPAPVALEVGDRVPDVALTTLDGQPAVLDLADGTTRGLLFWDANCGFCRQIVDEVRAVAGVVPGLLVVARGDAAATAAQDLGAATVHDGAQALATVLGVPGTPTAVLVDGDGRVASAPGVGGPAALALLRTPLPA